MGATHVIETYPYNGALFTTTGVRTLDVAPMSISEATKLALSRVDFVEQWGDAEAIPLAHETPAVCEDLAPIDVTINVTAAMLANKDKLLKALAKAAGLPKNAVNITVSRTSGEVTHKTRHAAPKEKTETRYFVTRASAIATPNWDTGYATQAEARAAISQIAQAQIDRCWEDQFPLEGSPLEFEIISRTRRVSGEPLVSSQTWVTGIKNATYTVRAQIEITPARVGKDRAGWLFHGWVAE